MPKPATAEIEAVGDEQPAGDGSVEVGTRDQGEASGTRWGTRAAVAMLGAVVAVMVGWAWVSGQAEQATPTSRGESDEAAPEPRAEPEKASSPRKADPPEASPEAPVVASEKPAPELVPKGPLPFDEPTGAALIFDAGAEGAVVLDVDTGSTTRLRLPRGDAAAQPYPLMRRGAWLVVAQHGGWAFVPRAGPEVTARWLADGQFAVPAAEPEQVWLIDEGDSQGEATWTLVEVTGEVLAQVQVDEGYTPIRGVPGGLAVRDDDGAVLVYDVGIDGLGTWLDDGARVLDATADRVLTCTGPCRGLAVRDEEGAMIQRLSTDGVRGHGSGWLSPDGSLLASLAVVYLDEGASVGVEVRIYDVDEGDLLDRAATTLGDFAGSWTPDGEQFFYRTVTDGPPTPLGRYTVGEGFEAASLDVLDAPLGHFVATSRERLADNGDES